MNINLVKLTFGLLIVSLAFGTSISWTASNSITTSTFKITDDNMVNSSMALAYTVEFEVTEDWGTTYPEMSFLCFDDSAGDLFSTSDPYTVGNGVTIFCATPSECNSATSTNSSWVVVPLVGKKAPA